MFLYVYIIMKKRNFLLSLSGFVIGSGITSKTLHQPSLAASFNINESVYISTEDGNFTELNMNISSFKLYASNLVNISEDINLEISANINNIDKIVYEDTINVDSKSFEKDLHPLNIEFIGVDKFNADTDFNIPVDGGDVKETDIDINIKLTHKDIENKTLTQKFTLIIENSPTVIESFENVGSHKWPVPSGINNVDVLIVGGGGSGGNGDSGTNDGAGGGGAGEVIHKTISVNPSDIITISVGSGGVSSNSSASTGTNGSNSSFGEFNALGGGSGGGASNNGNDGASGGGSGGASSTGGEPTSSSGYAGGFSNTRSGAGGGGAGEEGQNAVNSNTAGDGGNGIYKGDIFTDEFGDDGWFGGGGGGGTADGGPRSEGGKGGGGKGGQDRGLNPQKGMKNTGGGGGGGTDEYADYSSGAGKNGGSGIVIIKYTE
jgi:hypothetical protein